MLSYLFERRPEYNENCKLHITQDLMGRSVYGIFSLL